MGVPSQQTPFVLSGDGSLIPMRLIRAGYIARRPLKKLLLLQRHRQARMDWLETISVGDQAIGSMSSSAMNPDSCFTG